MPQELTKEGLIRARNNVFYNILYKDISHDELVALFEKEFGITAQQVDRATVSDGVSNLSELVSKNESRRKEVSKIKRKLYY
jgi:hypothetical protein